LISQSLMKVVVHQSGHAAFSIVCKYTVDQFRRSVI